MNEFDTYPGWSARLKSLVELTEISVKSLLPTLVREYFLHSVSRDRRSRAELVSVLYRPTNFNPPVWPLYVDAYRHARESASVVVLRSELVEEFRKRLGIPLEDASEVAEAFLEKVREEVQNENRDKGSRSN